MLSAMALRNKQGKGGEYKKRPPEIAQAAFLVVLETIVSLY